MAAKARLITISMLARLAQGEVSGLLDPPTICNGTFADRTSTGIASFNPEVYQITREGQPDNDAGKTLPLSLAVTVSEANHGTQWQTSFWSNTNGANYDTTTQLGCFVCAMALTGMTNSTLNRAQNDNYNILLAEV